MAPRLAAWRAAPRRKAFLLSDLKAALSLLLNSSYVTFAGRVWWQRVGIPMGGNCAVFLANLFIFAYELAFLQRLALTIHTASPAPSGPAVRAITASGVQLVHPACVTHTLLPLANSTLCFASSPLPPTPAHVALFIADSFRFLSRFVDDLYTLNNPLFPLLTYTNQSLPGFPFLCGVYPPTLSLKTTASGPSVPFLDLTICPAAPDSFPLTTRLFDKRWQWPFAVVKYPHITSKLSYSSKFGVLSSQYHRFRDIILDPDDFCLSLARLIRDLATRGHCRAACTERARRLLSRHPPLFPHTPAHLFHSMSLHLSSLTGSSE